MHKKCFEKNLIIQKHCLLCVLRAMRPRVVTVGVAPWGTLRSRERLVGKSVRVAYEARYRRPRQHYASGGAGGTGTGSIDCDGQDGVLNDRHSYFLLADDGTSGRSSPFLFVRLFA